MHVTGHASPYQTIKQLNVEDDQVDCCSGWIHCPSSVIATKFCTSCSLHVTLRFCHLNANEQHYEQRIRTWCTIGRGNIGQTCTSHEYEAFPLAKVATSAQQSELAKPKTAESSLIAVIGPLAQQSKQSTYSEPGQVRRTRSSSRALDPGREELITECPPIAPVPFRIALSHESAEQCELPYPHPQARC